MKISIAADHAGFAQKEQLREYLVNNGHEVTDRGTYKEERVDYPDFAKKVAHDILTGEAERGERRGKELDHLVQRDGEGRQNDYDLRRTRQLGRP